ncbi:MAG: T9SS type A sorting domain-containing protein [Candidatus Kapabacteria bacterium]|jgi:hypothetical protein|nr:T9SS type A sorting domain-containing protein [Candidatus Kapabacteria bacterium]
MIITVVSLFFSPDMIAQYSIKGTLHQLCPVFPINLELWKDSTITATVAGTVRGSGRRATDFHFFNLTEGRYELRLNAGSPNVIPRAALTPTTQTIVLSATNQTITGVTFVNSVNPLCDVICGGLDLCEPEVLVGFKNSPSDTNQRILVNVMTPLGTRGFFVNTFGTVVLRGFGKTVITPQLRGYTFEPPRLEIDFGQSFSSINAFNLGTAFSVQQVVSVLSDNSVNTDQTFTLRPNPILSQTAMVEYRITTRSRVKLSVLTMLGEEVLSISKVLSDGQYTEELDVSNLGNGAYLLVLQVDNARKFLKFLKTN